MNLLLKCKHRSKREYNLRALLISHLRFLFFKYSSSIVKRSIEDDKRRLLLYLITACWRDLRSHYSSISTFRLLFSSYELIWLITAAFAWARHFLLSMWHLVASTVWHRQCYCIRFEIWNVPLWGFGTDEQIVKRLGKTVFCPFFGIFALLCVIMLTC